MSGRPLLDPPFPLPWDAKARLLAAYAAECLSVAARHDAVDADKWRAEAKKAAAKSKGFLAIHTAKPETAPPPWPYKDDPA